MSVSVTALKNMHREVTNTFGMAKNNQQKVERLFDIGSIHFKTVIELPVDNRYREVFEKMGFRFTDKNHVTMPKGWSVKSTTSQVQLFDNLGRNRGSFYNYMVNGIKRTVIELVRRYTPIFRYIDNDTQIAGCIQDNANGEIIYEVWRGDRMHFNAFEVSACMHEYLEMHYPEWEDFCAYW